MTLDAIDAQILRALQDNARAPNKSIAAEVHLSESSCAARIRRLQAEGFIKGFHAELDVAKLGRPLEALIAIRCHHRDTERAEPFAEALLGLPETQALFMVTGDDDFQLLVSVRDMAHLRQFVLASLRIRPEVERIRTAIVFEQRRRQHHVDRPS